MTNDRPTWDQYFIGVADAVARRAACTRRRVGAVLTVDRRIVATGYNGAPAGAGECTDGHCPRGTRGLAEVPSLSAYEQAGSCIAIHAEANALQQFVNSGSLQVATGHIHRAVMYINYKPCEWCVDLMIQAGIPHWAFALPRMDGTRDIYYVWANQADPYQRHVKV